MTEDRRRWPWLGGERGVKAHCHSVWRYPWPQRCGFCHHYSPGHRAVRCGGAVDNSAFCGCKFRPKSGTFEELKRTRHEASFASETKPPSLDPDIPLPSLARTDCDGGAADEPTRARILLRAALEAANGH